MVIVAQYSWDLEPVTVLTSAVGAYGVWNQHDGQVYTPQGYEGYGVIDERYAC